MKTPWEKRQAGFAFGETRLSWEFAGDRNSYRMQKKSEWRRVTSDNLPTLLADTRFA